MDQLKFVAADLVELIKMARLAKADMLTYFLELAFAEASDEINKRQRLPRDTRP